jgi:hypothetical protein
MGYRALACLGALLMVIASPASAQLGPATATTAAPAENSSSVDLSYERAWQNYTAVVSGARDLSQLSTIELQELILLDREIRAHEPDRRSRRQKCLDAELDSLGGPPSALALRTIDLKCSQR